MGNAVIDMSMSLDGYIAAPNDNPQQGPGEDGMRLHNWAFDDPSVFERVYGNLIDETGAVIMGRRSYDNSIEAWGGKSSRRVMRLHRGDPYSPAGNSKRAMIPSSSPSGTPRSG